MNTLQDLFEQSLKNYITPERVIPKLISKRLREYGISFTEEQEEKLSRRIVAEDFQSLTIELSDEQEAQFNMINGASPLNIHLGEDEVEGYILRLNEVIEEFLVNAPTELGPILLEGFKEISSKTLQQIALANQAYQKLILERWNKPFTLLEMLLSLCIDAGANFNEEFREGAVQTSDYVFEALTRLHARGCQVGSEILTLLKHGFADGAYARWRTLHEITVVAQFLALFGNEVAERYLLHRSISDYLDAQDHQQHHKALGWAPISFEDMNALKAAYDELRIRYGKGFSKTYGWAASVFQETKPDHNPTFSDIEEKVGMAHARPFYILANLNVHANAKSILFRLGLPENHEDVLVAGPSYYGLAEPGQATAWTINLLTVTLLLHKPNLDMLALLGAFNILVGEIYEAFSKAELKVGSDKGQPDNIR